MNTELAVTQHEPEPECRLSSSETATILAWRSGSEPGEPLPDQCFLRWQSVGFKDVKLKLLRTPNTPPFTFTTERASWIVQPAVNLAMDILACPRGRKVLTMMVQELPEEIKDPVVYQIGPKAIVQQFLLRLRENFAKVYITDSLQRDVQIWSLVWGHDSSELSRFLTWRPSSEVSVFLRRHAIETALFAWDQAGAQSENGGATPLGVHDVRRVIFFIGVSLATQLVDTLLGLLAGKYGTEKSCLPNWQGIFQDRLYGGRLRRLFNPIHSRRAQQPGFLCIETQDKREAIRPDVIDHFVMREWYLKKIVYFDPWVLDLEFWLLCI